jgi:ligand-binding SRPBCC domain-containing protein
MKIYSFESKLLVPRIREEVFDFFSNALNLESLTPPWLRFHVVTPTPIEMAAGTEIEYRLKVHGIPMAWRSRITVWEPPQRFVDEQLKGPYRLWIHEHRFVEHSGGTVCEDHLRYAPIGGSIVNRLVVEKDVKRIFAYRSERLLEIFGHENHPAPGSSD